VQAQGYSSSTALKGAVALFDFAFFCLGDRNRYA
jgi:hypothetical protein